MGKYNFDQTIDRRKTYSARWDVKEGELPLNIADMDFEVLPEIKDAIRNRADLDCYGYIDTPKQYFESYISWWKTRHDLDLDIKWFCFSTSVVGSIDSIFKRICRSGEQVVMLTPNYNVFFNCIKNNGLVVKECDFIYQDYKYEIDWDKFENILKAEKTKVFILCNPHNPIGYKFSKDEIDRFINLCEKYNVYVISDEIHCDFDLNNSPYTPVYKSQFSNYKKLIVLLSPTKTFNIAGLQTSAVVIKDDELRNLIQKGLYQDDIGEPNYFGVDPVIAAYNYGHDYVDELNDYIRKNKEIFADYLLKNLPKLKIVGGDTTYLGWIDISNYSGDSKEFCNKLREATGLILAPGINYGSSANQFVRINLATPRKNVLEACQRLSKFLSRKGE